MRGFRCFLHQVVCEEKNDSLEREQSIYCNRKGYLRTLISVYIHKEICLFYICLKFTYLLAGSCFINIIWAASSKIRKSP